MARRFRQYAGLLSRLLLAVSLCLGMPARNAFSASGPEEPLRVVVFRAPDSPRDGGSFTLTLFIDHPRPQDVSVDAPVFPPSLRLERTRVEPRLFPGTAGSSERWTTVEYSFRPASSGEFRIGSFVVRAAGKSAESAPFTLSVGGGAPAAARKSLAWDGAPLQAAVGSSFEIRLIASGFVPDGSLLPGISAPENAILEALAVSEADRLSGTVARFRATLMDSTPFRLPPLTLRLGDGSEVAAPPLAVAAVGAPSGGRVPVALVMRDSPNMPKPARPSFPEESQAAFPGFVRASTAPILESARRDWEKGSYGAAVATLRAAERDSVFGLFIRPTRREAEKSLSLPPSRDEAYAPLVPLAVSALAGAFVFALFGAAALLEAVKRNAVTSRRRRRFMIISAAAALFALASSRLVFAGARKREAVVLSACRSLRVPDPVSAASAEFSEGQAARATSSTGAGEGSWLFVETDDGRSGWIEAVYAHRY